MKKQLTTILFAFVCVSNFAQITFDKGYYINNNDQKIEVLIKNIDWANNPTSFEFKQNVNSEVKTITIEDVKEFGVYNFSKYIRKTIDIDRASNLNGELSSNRNVKFNKEQLFLKILVDGNATLYLYQEGNLTRFFYKKPSSKIEQLIYKRYKISPTKIRKNNQYQQQLWNNLKCEKISLKDVERLDYKVAKLVDFFVKYNTCSDKGFVNFEEIGESRRTNYNIRVGLTNSSIVINQPLFIFNDDKLNVLEYRLGFEIEHILSFNRSKWGILLEPVYQTYSATKNSLTNFGADPDYELSVNNSRIDLGIGIRHFLFLNDNSKLFVNALVNLRISGDVQANYDDLSNTNFDYKLNPTSLILGLGYKSKEKYSIELRYESKEGGKNFISPAVSYESNMLSIIFGYKLF